MRMPDVVWLSVATWNKMTPEQQRTLMDSAAAALQFQRKLWQEKSQECLETVAAAGVTILRPDQEPFREKVLPMYATYDGTPIGQMIERIRAEK
jgi:TRAP-type C4-dicarboxylate transport system substrate-binding protein